MRGYALILVYVTAVLKLSVARSLAKRMSHDVRSTQNLVSNSIERAYPPQSHESQYLQSKAEANGTGMRRIMLYDCEATDRVPSGDRGHRHDRREKFSVDGNSYVFRFFGRLAQKTAVMYSRPTAAGFSLAQWQKHSTCGLDLLGKQAFSRESLSKSRGPPFEVRARPPRIGAAFAPSCKSGLCLWGYLALTMVVALSP